MRGLALRKGEKEGAAAEITPMQMIQVAVRENVDIDKLQKLMEFKERWEADEARKAYVVAMTAFKKTPLEIVKDTHVKYKNKGGGETDYYHATLSQVVAVVAPALAQHGLSYTWKTSQEQSGQITVECIITHEGGHSSSVSLMGMPDQSGGKNAIQAIASTVTYLERHTLMAATGTAAKDQDDDGAGGAPSGKPAPMERPKREDYTDTPPPETDHGEPFELLDEYGGSTGQYDDPGAWLDAASKYLGKDLSAAAGAAKTFQEHNQGTLDRISDALGSARDNPRLSSFYTLLNGKRGD